jgi:hypothetical protein
VFVFLWTTIVYDPLGKRIIIARELITLSFSLPTLDTHTHIHSPLGVVGQDHL